MCPARARRGEVLSDPRAWSDAGSGDAEGQNSHPRAAGAEALQRGRTAATAAFAGISSPRHFSVRRRPSTPGLQHPEPERARPQPGSLETPSRCAPAAGHSAHPRRRRSPSDLEPRAASPGRCLRASLGRRREHLEARRACSAWGATALSTGPPPLAPCGHLPRRSVVHDPSNEHRSGTATGHLELGLRWPSTRPRAGVRGVQGRLARGVLGASSADMPTRPRAGL